MMKGPDGSLRPEPGELQRRLTKIEELNQAQPLMRSMASDVGDTMVVVFFSENGNRPFLKKDLWFFVVTGKWLFNKGDGEGMHFSVDE